MNQFWVRWTTARYFDLYIYLFFFIYLFSLLQLPVLIRDFVFTSVLITHDHPVCLESLWWLVHWRVCYHWFLCIYYIFLLLVYFQYLSFALRDIHSDLFITFCVHSRFYNVRAAHVCNIIGFVLWLLFIVRAQPCALFNLENFLIWTLNIP